MIRILINKCNEILRKQPKTESLDMVSEPYTRDMEGKLLIFWTYRRMQYLIEEDGVYRMYRYTDDSYDYIIDDHETDEWEMGYSDVTGGARYNNYILEILPGETKEVHLAWLVTEDNLDHMYLELNGSSLFSEETLATGLVKLNMP